jgi:hypothetical protein
VNLLRAAVGVVSLLSEMVAREYRRLQLPHWPDGEQPLVDPHYVAQVAPEGAISVWGVMPYQASVSGSAVPEAGVEPKTEGPTPGAAQTPGVGHPKLLHAAACQLYAYAMHVACPAAIYVTSLADQLSDAAAGFENTNK